MADRGHSTLTKLGMGTLTFNSALAVYSSSGNAGSVAFVLAADAALVLLFLCLRELEQATQEGAGTGRDTKIKAAVWALTALLTAMFASGVAPIVPLAVGVLVFLCLREVDHQVRVGEGDGRANMEGQYCALGKMGFAVQTCKTAVDAYGARRDPGSAAFALVSYVALLIMTGLFVRTVARAHAAEQGQR